jgi:hypothetical protein
MASCVLTVARVSNSIGSWVAYNIKCKWDYQTKETERKEEGGQNETICEFEKLYFFLSEGHEILRDRNNL